MHLIHFQYFFGSCYDYKEIHYADSRHQLLVYKRLQKVTSFDNATVNERIQNTLAS